MTMRNHARPRGSSPGFTLIEILIVVAIIGILAAVGYPAYRDFALQGKRTDAHTALTRVAAQQERHFSDNNAYGTLQNLGYPASTFTSPEGYWTISATNNATSFTVTAVPGGTRNHVDAGCTSIILNNAGARTAAGSDAADCWP